MLLPKVLVLIAVLLPMVISTADVHVANRKKRTISYAVEGCFSGFPGAGESILMGSHNSNIKCQETCRDKGYILAATRDRRCQCGNIYPRGKKVDDSRCTTTCQQWSGWLGTLLTCHGPQSCCGGPSAYSVSVVGDIDVAKLILRRLSRVWQKSPAYRKYMISRVNKPSTESHDDNWWTSFNSEGWSYCAHSRYMTGLYRNDEDDSDGIYRIEEARCADAPGYLYSIQGDRDCYNHDWWDSFDDEGWSTCNDGYYMTGLYRNSGDRLYHIEEAKCCRPKSQVESWGTCYNLDVWDSFNDRGWSTCASGYYMAGLYRNSCDGLYCLEEFKCCQMGAYNGDSLDEWIGKPDLVIKVKDAFGKLKRCSMNAIDKSGSTYKCEATWGRTNMLELDALKFTVEEDTSRLNVAKTQPLKGSRPVTCSAHANPYKCAKSFKATLSTSSTLKISAGFSLAAKVGKSVEFSAQFSGLGAKATFSDEITKTRSFNVESIGTNTYMTTDQTDVSIQVPANKQLTIKLMRDVQDFEYKWQATFKLLGKYSVKWASEQEIFEDVTTVLSGPRREIYAFGSWSYPNTGAIKVEITDRYGNKKSGCKHEPGKGKRCIM